jgi:sugar lactone lactonase YvrE
VGGGGGGGAGDYTDEQGGAGGYGGGGGGGTSNGGAGGYGGGVGGAGSPTGGGGGNGMGGAIFNQLGQVYLYSVTFSGNRAEGGTTPSDAPGNGVAGNGLGGAVANLDGELWMTDVSTSGDSVQTGYGSPGQGSDVYVTSDPAGLTSATQTPAAILHLVGTSIPSSAIALNQVSGTVTETTSEPVGQAEGSLTVTVPITQAGTIGPAPYVVTGGALGLDFNLVSGGTCAQGASFTVGQTCTVNYSFTPTAVGLRQGAISVISNSFQPMGSVFVSNTAQGTQVAFAPGSQTPIAGDWEDGVGGTAVDGFGTIYVAEVYDGTIEYISKNNQYGGYYAPSVLISGLGMPTSVAVDGAGDIFYTDWLYSAVYELPFDGYSYQNTVSLGLDVGWSSPQSVAVDAQGNVFVTDLDQNGVFELPWTGTGFGPSVPLPSYNFGYMANVAVDPAENVYVTDNDNNQVVEYPFTTSGYGTPIVIPVSTPSLWGIATDAVGNLYLSDSATGTIMSMMAQPGWQFGPLNTIATGVNTPLGMALDPNGNIFVATGGGTSIVKIDQFDPPAINFVTATSVGSVDTTDGPQTVSVFNTGNLPLVFTPPSTGSNPSYPTGILANISDTNLCTSTAPVANGGSCDVSVNFMPTAVGSFSGNIVLTDNAPGSPHNFAVNGTGSQSAQTITFAPPTSPEYFGASPITLVASGGASGNPVTFSIVSGPGSLSGTNNSVLTLTGAGTIVIAANQAGNGAYTAAPQVTQSIVVDQPAVLTSPAPGSTILGSSATFTWSAAIGSGNQGYFLFLGTTGVGSKDLYDSGQQTATSATFKNLPNKSETIYARVYTKFNGVLVYNDYTYTKVALAVLTSPAPGSTLAGTSVTFTWSAATGPGFQGYFLFLGTTGVGSKDLYDSGQQTATSATFNNLPNKGQTIYARLYSKFNGTLVYNDYTYSTVSPAVLTSPTPGSTLLGPSVTFTWSAGSSSGNQGYWLFIGTTGVGSNDLYSSGQTTATSATFKNIPNKGETIYVRINTEYNGTYVFHDYTYSTVKQAVLTSPAAGIILVGPSVTFTWSAASSSGNQGYWLYLGTTGVGSKDLYDSGQTTATSATFKSLPNKGETIYARVYTKFNGTLVYNDYTFSTVTQAVLTSPAPGATLVGPSVTFTWSAGSSSGNQGYWLYLGTTGVGSKDLYDSGKQAATSATFKSLPNKGETIYARVYTMFNGVLVYNDYTYSTVTQAVMTSPTPGSTLAGASQTFTWTAATGPGIQGYWLFLGTTGVGSKDLYDSGKQTAVSATFKSLPTNGATVYARVYTSYNGILVYNDYTYKAQ